MTTTKAFLTVLAAAEAAGLGPEDIETLVEAGQLESLEVDERLLVSLDSVTAFTQGRRA